MEIEDRKQASRRQVLLGTLSAASASQTPVSAATGHGPFQMDSVYLDAAFAHPVGDFARDAAVRYVSVRRAGAKGVGPASNPRNAAVERFAALIGAQAEDVAVVPSTLEAENRVNAALGIGPGHGVVTDALHYDGALALYHHLSVTGTSVTVVHPRGNVVQLDDIRAAIAADTRLIAVSLVSSTTGFAHDLAELCALAHRHGVLVYADVIQAAGASPLDVKASGVDFVGCGAYKWLMGEYGCAFLYVRPDRRDRLKRVQVGWRQIARHESHVLPFEPPGPAIGGFTLRDDAAGLFEVSTPAWNGLAIAAASIDYVLDLGVQKIAAHRAPLIDFLQEELPRRGLVPLTPRGGGGPIVSFALRDAKLRLEAPLREAKIQTSTYPHRLRVSPSVYNTIDDVRLLADVVASALKR